LLLFGATQSAGAVTLKIATVAPDGTSWMREMRAAAATIQERTDGRVKLKFYPGGVMGNEPTAMRKIRAGQLHGGAFTTGTLASLARDTELYGVPFLFRSYAEVDFVRQRFDPQVARAVAQVGLVPLALSETGFAYFMSEKPIRSEADLKQRKVWTPQGDILSRTALELVGVTPVMLPLADVYTALQTGLVDTVAAPPMAAIAFQWHTRVKYVSDVPLIYLLGVFVVDERAFKRLSEPDRAVLREVVGATAARVDAETRKGNQSAREALLGQGIQFVSTTSVGGEERWREVGDQALDRLQREKALYSAGSVAALRGYLREYREAQAANGVEP
jgi:TRAP-type C4-dicarboxylate transport system substrate-binding protein